jgi:hypothetical protein
LSDDFHKKVMAARWYEIGGHLWVSEAEVEDPDGEDPIHPTEMDSDPSEEIEIMRVAESLKRFSDNEGYFHA